MSDVLSLLKQWDNLLGEGGKQKIYALFIKEKESVKAKKKNPPDLGLQIVHCLTLQLARNRRKNHQII